MGNGAKKLAAISATHWNDLANAEIDAEAWDRQVGIGPPPGSSSPRAHKAATYRAQAWAAALEADTGAEHCSTCFKPHPAHKHGVVSP